MPDRTTDPIDRQYRTYMENNYSPVPRDDQERMIESVVSLLELARDKKQTIRTILEQTARTIFRLFAFAEIGIGLKDKKDNMYKYEVLFGYRKELEEKFRKVVYTHDDMVSYDKFPNVKTGLFSEFNPVEGLPEDEKVLFNRQSLITQKRESFDDFGEGDYMDFWMYDHKKDLTGWIELARPKDGKMPPRTSVRWIELIAGVCASIISQKWMEEELAHK